MREPLGAWPRVVSAALGIWMMFAPSILDYDRPAATNDRIVGPIVASFAIIAIWQVTRGLRWLNLVLGVWLLVAPWVLGYAWEPLLNSSIVGVIIIACAAVRGPMNDRTGGGWSAIWGGGPPPPPSSDEPPR